MLLLQKELLWLQKSRNDWLGAGDGNIKFSLTLMLVRRRRNKIESLQNDQVVWVEDREALKNMALNFYEDLFTSDPSAGGAFMRSCFLPASKEVRRGLEAEFSFAYTRKALKGMGLLKASRPDGYQPVFFKKTWNLTSQALFCSRSAQQR